MDIAAFECESATLFDNIYLGLEIERKLLEAEDPDWAELQVNLKSIEDLFEQLPLNAEEWAQKEAACSLLDFCKNLDKIIELRRENTAILQLKTNKMGSRIALHRREKAAHLAYTSCMDHAGPKKTSTSTPLP